MKHAAKAFLSLTYALTDSLLGCYFLFVIMSSPGVHIQPPSFIDTNTWTVLIAAGMFSLFIIFIVTLSQYSMQADSGHFETSFWPMVRQAFEPYVFAIFPVVFSGVTYWNSLSVIVVSSLSARVFGHFFAIAAAPFFVEKSNRKYFNYYTKTALPIYLFFFPCLISVFIGFRWVVSSESILGMVLSLVIFCERIWFIAKTIEPADFHNKEY